MLTKESQCSSVNFGETNVKVESLPEAGKRITDVDKNMEKLKLLCTAGEGVKWC